MQKIRLHDSDFYIDDLTRELSKHYDVRDYKGYFNTLGESNTECAMGRMLFFAKLCGEFVGTDFDVYKKKFRFEQWFDYPDAVHSEKDLELYVNEASKIIYAEPLRIEEAGGKRIYFPTEELVKRFIQKGTGFIPFDKFWEFQERRN